MPRFPSQVQKKKPIRQPQANPVRPPKPPKPVATPTPPPPSAEEPPSLVAGKTNAQIIEEKMAAMAADPMAVPVYWTETGPDPAGWDVIFPEFKVLTEAFRGGYGWYDLTEGRGRHLLPERKPYKIVRITKEELKALRAKEQAEEEARKAKMEAERRARKAEKMRRRREAAQEEQARNAMAEEDCRMKTLMEEERRLAQKAKDDAEQAHWAIARLLTEIRALPAECQYQDYLVEYIVDRLDGMEPTVWEPVVETVCKTVEKEGLLFVTPRSSPDVGPICGPADPPPIELSPPTSMPSTAFVEEVAKEYNKIQAFIRSPWITLNGVLHMPAVDAVKGYQYIPVELVHPSPPLPPLPPCDCLECCPPPSACYCAECCSPPLPPLPVVKARLVPLPPLLPTPSTPPIVVKKLRMPSAQRLQKFLRAPNRPAPRPTTTSTRSWKDSGALIASFK